MYSRTLTSFKVTTVRADTRLNGALGAVEVLKDDAKRVRVAGVNMVLEICKSKGDLPLCMSSVHFITEPRFTMINEQLFADSDVTHSRFLPSLQACSLVTCWDLERNGASNVHNSRRVLRSSQSFLPRQKFRNLRTAYSTSEKGTNKVVHVQLMQGEKKYEIA